MKPIGKTYLIKMTRPENQVIQGGIIVQNDISSSDLFYKGVITEYGTGWTKQQEKNLYPIGMTVYTQFHDKTGIKTVIGKNIYYIYDHDHIIASEQQVKE